MNEMRELPEFPKFQSLAFEDKALLDFLFKQMQQQMSELTFTNLYIWNDTEPFSSHACTKHYCYNAKEYMMTKTCSCLHWEKNQSPQC